MSKAIQFVGSTCVMAALVSMVVNVLVESFGGGTEHSILIGLVWTIAWGVVGIGLLKLADAK